MTGALTPLWLDGLPAVPGLAVRTADESDWPALASLLNRAHAADGVEEVQTAESLRMEWEPLGAFRLGRDVLLAEIAGEPVAFCVGYRVARDALLVLESFGAVAPEHRARGIGTALHRATRRRLAAEAAEDRRPGVREFRTYCLEIETGYRALLEDEGFVPIRFGFEMRRSLTGSLPEHALPAGIELRPVTPDQHRAIFDADNEAFRDHWGFREFDEGDYRARFDHPDTDPSLWQVAWDGDEVAGVVMNVVFESENATLGINRGWLEHVSVRRPWRGRGLAKALCAASFRTLREHGLDEAWLGVDAANPTGALQLYEGLGFGVVRRWYAFGRPLEGPASRGWQSAAGPNVSGP